MKYACKYALKNVKICIKNLKNHLNMHQKSQFSLENTQSYTYSSKFYDVSNKSQAF